MIRLKNYNKLSDPLYKKIGDICLFSIPLYIPIIMTLPIDGVTKLWISGALSFILATVKIISKFTLDPNYVESNNKTVEKSN